MNGYLILYEALTGKIYQSMPSNNSEEDKEHFKTVDAYWSSVNTTVLYAETVEKVHPDLHWIECVDANCAVKPKMTFPALTVTNGLIENIPYGTTVVWPDYESTEEFDGSVEIESNVSGKFKFTFDSPKHVLHKIEVVYSV